MKNKLYMLAAGVMLLMLSACAALGGPQATQKGMITACNGYASALTTLAIYNMNGKLSKSQVDSINQANKIVHPLCTAPDMVSNPQQATVMIQNAIMTLTTIQSQVKGAK